MTQEEFYKKYWEMVESYVGLCKQLEKYEAYPIQFPIVKKMRKLKEAYERKLEEANV